MEVVGVLDWAVVMEGREQGGSGRVGRGTVEHLDSQERWEDMEEHPRLARGQRGC